MCFFNRVVRLLFYQIENFGCEVQKKNYVKKMEKNLSTSKCSNGSNISKVLMKSLRR